MITPSHRRIQNEAGAFLTLKIELGDFAIHLASMSAEALPQMLLGIAESTRAKWVKLAQANLHTTRQAYLLGLQQPEVEGSSVSISLVGKWPNLIEHGASSFDIRAAMLSEDAKGVRTAKDGHRYRYIGMRISGPKSRGAVGQPIEHVYSPPGAGSKSRRSNVFGVLQRTSGGDRTPAQAFGQHAWALATKLRPGKALGELGLPLLQSHHSRDAFSGMVKSGAKGHRYYAVFRTMTERVDKWEHPGLTARNFAEGAARHAAKIAPAAMRRFMKAALSAHSTPEPTPPED